MSDKLQKLQELITLANDGLTREEFLKAFSDVVEFVKKAEKNLSEKIDNKTASAESALSELNQVYQETIKRVEEESTSSLSNVKRWALEEVGKLMAKSKINEKIKEVDARLTEINRLEWPDETAIAKEASRLAQEELKPLIPTVPNLEAELPKLGESIRDGLEMLEGPERLSIKAIDKLQEQLDELRKMISQKSGGIMGGVAQVREVTDRSTDGTLTGTINGVNTIFTLRQAASSDTTKIFVNGSRLDLTNDYTLSGTTLTFVTAPPTGSNILVDYRY